MLKKTRLISSIFLFSNLWGNGLISKIDCRLLNLEISPFPQRVKIGKCQKSSQQTFNCSKLAIETQEKGVICLKLTMKTPERQL